MLGAIFRKIIGTANARALKKYEKVVARINALEPEMEKLSDAKLKARTEEFKGRLKKGETLGSLLPEAFAVVREAAKRTIGQRHYDVQLIGGMILHDGKITEMKTGEGKTLVATLPVYLNALTGKGVHIVTVNDYLAARDAEWMGKIHRFLGLSVGCIINELDDDARREAYACDITYGTNHEFGFDYLRDNMKFRLESLVQRPFNYAIVDEVDSILIDEARTPLIISGAADNSSDLYIAVDEIIPQLKSEHCKVDEKDRQATLTESGIDIVENLLFERGITKIKNLYDISNAQVLHHIDKALAAHKLYKSNVDYLVKDGEVFIIDEFNGRIMEGRRYSDGLHQALEAKERVEIKKESQTLASITYQNYFRLYPKLAGMTGTALTEAEEFEEIYKLKCLDVPTNLPVKRVDFEDEIYLDEKSKFDAIVALIKDCHKRQQPVLVGTVSIEKSEKLADYLKKEGIKDFNVLNAKYHEREAYIIAEAGVPGTITIATNMAGRGTDIQLGGNFDMRFAQETSGIDDVKLIEKKAEEIKHEIARKKKIALEAGGLFVIGTERHESRRIDNQLRGRTGRQGDPGSSKFFLSMDDDLMRIFGGPKMKAMLEKLGLKPGEAITHSWVSKSLEKAQVKVEARNFSIRKNLLKYDDVMNDQRKIVYAQRYQLMSMDDVSGISDDFRADAVESVVSAGIPERSMPEDWDAAGLSRSAAENLGLQLDVNAWIADNPNISEQTVFERVKQAADLRMKEQRTRHDKDFMHLVEKSVLLQTLDQVWKENLLQLDYLKKGIGLRAYGQKDPLNEYKKESFFIFEENMDRLRMQVTRILLTTNFTREGVEAITEEQEAADAGSGVETRPEETSIKVDPNYPRNAPCPCGSGKKYKHCHGRLA